MTYFIVFMLAVVAAQQLLDIWTTWQVLRIGGRERNRIVRAAMHLVGVLPALILLKAAVLAALAWAACDDWPGSLEFAGGLALIAAFYVWVLANNFRALKAQRANAVAGRP